MKIRFCHLLIAMAALALATLNSQLSTALAQGSLTPQSAPAPTMKSLSQIEPRTPISSLPYTISAPGSYYVTTNLTGVSGSDGITIIFLPVVENVTVDLNGFTLTGVAGSHNGIHAAALIAGHNYAFRNGTLRNWGMDGVNASGAMNSRFEKLQLYGNANIGLEAGTNCIVSDCAAYSNAVAGISVLTGGDLSHCVAANNGIGLQTLDGCVMADCTASGNSGDGINVGIGTLVRNCASYQNGYHGIITSSGCIIKDCVINNNVVEGINGGDYSTVNACTVTSNNIEGISVGNYCVVTDCTVSGNSNAGNGISVRGSNCQIAGNTCSGNDGGIQVLGSQNRIDNNSVGNNLIGIGVQFSNVGNSITRNSAPGNGIAGYGNTTANNDFAPIQTPSTATSPWANF
jgi:parallel beta-helix repeat protein